MPIPIDGGAHMAPTGRSLRQQGKLFAFVRKCTIQARTFGAGANDQFHGIGPSA